MIHNSAVFTRYWGPLGDSRLAVIQCKIHMLLLVRAWCVHFPSLLTRMFLLRWLQRFSIRSWAGCDVTASYQQQSKGHWIGWFISSLQRDFCHVCCAPALMSFILRLSLWWQWLMTLSCRVLLADTPIFLSPIFVLCLTKRRIKERGSSQKTIDAICSKREGSEKNLILVNMNKEIQVKYNIYAQMFKCLSAEECVRLWGSTGQSVTLSLILCGRQYQESLTEKRHINHSAIITDWLSENMKDIHCYTGEAYGAQELRYATFFSWLFIFINRGRIIMIRGEWPDGFKLMGRQQ